MVQGRTCAETKSRRRLALLAQEHKIWRELCFHLGAEQTKLTALLLFFELAL